MYIVLHRPINAKVREKKYVLSCSFLFVSLVLFFSPMVFSPDLGAGFPPSQPFKFQRGIYAACILYNEFFYLFRVRWVHNLQFGGPPLR